MVNDDIWVQVREVIRSWLNVPKRSIRKLAEESEINPSLISRFINGRSKSLDAATIIKLYHVLHKEISAHEKLVLLEAAQLLELMAILHNEELFATRSIQLASPFTQPIDIGLHFMLQGSTCWIDRERSLAYFRQAEAVLGSGSGLAGRAATSAVLQLTELGDYDQAHKEMLRVQKTYGSVMGSDTKLHFYMVFGWLCYEMGRYAESKVWCQRCIDLAQTMGRDRTGQTAQHFLGRVYFDLGCLTHHKKEAEEYFRKAEINFDTVYQAHLTWDNKNALAYDLFRKAQLYRIQGKGDDAQALREQARQLFGKKPGRFSIDIEEALLDIENGRVQAPTHKLEDALRGWSDQNKAEDMAEAMRLLGTLNLTQGKLEQALELFVAALCVCPDRKNPEQQQLWSDIRDIRYDILNRHGLLHYQYILQGINEMIHSRQGYFAYLNDVHGDPDKNVAKVMSLLDFV